MSFVVCSFTSFCDWWNGKPKPQSSSSRRSRRIALSIPLVVETILDYVPTPQLRNLHLVNRTWNHEATRCLQRRKNFAKFIVPYDARTTKFVQLVNTALELEQEENIQWNWSFSKVKLTYSSGSSQQLHFAELEKLLSTISKQITVLRLENFGGVHIKDFPKYPPLLEFSRLREFTGQGNEQLVNWVLKQSPKLRLLDLYTKPHPRLEYSKFHLCSLYVHQPELSQKFLKSLAEFLLHQSNLRVLKISPCYWCICEPDFIFSVIMPNLVNLEISTNAAFILFGPPHKLPPVQDLKLHLDQPHPESWLSKWNGRGVPSVTELSLYRNPLKFDCVPLKVVHEICKMFPNCKILNLYLRFSNYPKRICLNTCVPRLSQLEELYVRLGGIWQLSPELRSPDSALKQLKALTLEYSSGCITAEHCDIFLLGMPKLKQ